VGKQSRVDPKKNMIGERKKKYYQSDCRNPSKLHSLKGVSSKKGGELQKKSENNGIHWKKILLKKGPSEENKV